MTREDTSLEIRRWPWNCTNPPSRAGLIRNSSELRLAARAGDGTDPPEINSLNSCRHPRARLIYTVAAILQSRFCFSPPPCWFTVRATAPRPGRGLVSPGLREHVPRPERISSLSARLRSNRAGNFQREGSHARVLSCIFVRDACSGALCQSDETRGTKAKCFAASVNSAGENIPSLRHCETRTTNFASRNKKIWWNADDRRYWNVFHLWDWMPK